MYRIKLCLRYLTVFGPVVFYCYVPNLFSFGERRLNDTATDNHKSKDFIHFHNRRLATMLSDDTKIIFFDTNSKIIKPAAANGPFLVYWTD